MAHPPRNPQSTQMFLAALSGGFAALLGGIIFVGGLILLDFHGIRTLSANDGWVRPLSQLAGIVACFGVMGFALGPMVAVSSPGRPGDR
ncbi:MAG: hypothetical protein AB7O80_09800 [Acetobacteraceae bacterium]